ncbi:histidine triad nucleotide-binding protein [Silvanigrella aquatica]|uniref:Histidine triad nucleotide-binding protein n=1 Tax=Silvanigrella aquatica TaxID=1915309 RepID=A0A1L4D1Y3_9BACT|nr:histidine triad nucleotide-binding protein [Silvanigrella aquatica]APJ04200.1 histidine triad nucleotide-binding protein [Silvanigrella aquatica]
MSEKTIFEKILQGEIPCKPVYEDEYTFAFNDINPQAPVHILIIPKKKIVNVAESNETDIEQMGRVLYTAKKVAELTGIAKTGYRLVMNNGDHGGQTVYYMHCHVLGGRSLAWPPG